MGRCTQFVGINDKARKYLEEHCNKIKVKRSHEYHNPRTGHTEYENSVGEILDSEVGDRFEWDGMFDGEGGFLKVYYLKNGSKIYEKVQDVVWSSGPMIFTALCDENDVWVSETLWTDDEMDYC